MDTRGRLFFCQQIGLKFQEESNKVLHVEHGFVTWTLWEVDQRYTESFEM